MENGAVWNIDYVDGKGFSLKNVGTGKYLKDAGNANHDDPTYFSFCTLATTTGIAPVTTATQRSSVVYDLMGRRVTDRNMRSGIYIRDGRKVVINR